LLQELNQHNQLAMEKIASWSSTFKENEEDDYILKVDEAMKNTQLP
jgi:hypothetical protein